MLLRNVFVWSVMICLFAGIGYGEGREDLKNYFNDAAVRVRNAATPQEKREILGTSLSRMSKAAEMAGRSPLVSAADREALRRFEASIREKQNELSGEAGCVRVPDEQLDAFASYTVQESEQAAETITISVVTLLLIIILVVLLVK
ncbi:MAG: hypothetical protein ACM3Q4_12640 [Acidobacteriota bacterium]